MSISSVAVIGCGPQGLSIVQAFAEAGYPVIAVQVTRDAGDAAKRRLRRTLGFRVTMGELSEARADALFEAVTFQRNFGSVQECDLVIESTVGDARSRRALMATLETHISRGAILAANAPPSLLREIAEVLSRPDQFVGLHFFHPATHTPEVELSLLPDTAPGVAATCAQLCQILSKTLRASDEVPSDTPPTIVEASR